MDRKTALDVSLLVESARRCAKHGRDARRAGLEYNYYEGMARGYMNAARLISDRLSSKAARAIRQRMAA